MNASPVVQQKELSGPKHKFNGADAIESCAKDAPSLLPTAGRRLHAARIESQESLPPVQKGRQEAPSAVLDENSPSLQQLYFLALKVKLRTLDHQGRTP